MGSSRCPHDRSGQPAARTADMAVIKERIQRGANRPSGVQNVVAKNDDVLAGNVEAQFACAFTHRPQAMRAEIVAVKLNIQNAGRDRTLDDAADQCPETLCEGYAATFDAHQRQSLGGVGLLHNLVR